MEGLVVSFLLVAAALLALSLLATCCSACCLLCFGGCCRSNPLCCLAAALLAFVGLEPRHRHPPQQYDPYGMQGQYGTVTVAHAASVVVVPPPPRVVYSSITAVPGASAPPAASYQQQTAEDAALLPLATPVYDASGRTKEDHQSYQKGAMTVEGEYPPPHIRSSGSCDAVALPSAPPALAGGGNSSSGSCMEDGGPRRVTLDAPLPPKGAEPRDLWAAVLFVVMTCLLVTLALRLGLPALGLWEADAGRDWTEGGGSTATVTAARTLLGVAVGLALVGGAVAMAWLHVMLHWSAALITSTLTCTAVGAGLLALLSLTLGYLAGFLFFALLTLAAVRLLRHERAQVFLSSANLSLACRALLDHKGVLGIAYLALIAELLWCALWTLAALGAYTYHNRHHQGRGGSTKGEGVAVVVFLAVSLYWGQQVCQNILRCTVVGTVAAWWYAPPARLSDASSGSGKAPSPVLPALARAAGPSLGSICVGSLIVSIIEGLRTLIRSMVQSHRLSCLGGCLLDCVAAWVEGAFRLANRFAFVFVGIWGYPYTTAASLGVQLFEAKGWQAVLNDMLIGETLLLGSLLVGGLTASLGVYLAHLDPQAFAGLPHPGLFLALSGFFLGLGNCLALLQTLGAAVDTVFVAWASDPDSLRRHRPVEYAHLLGAWRHYDECHGRRLAAGVVVVEQSGGGGGGGGGTVIYSEDGGRVVRVSV